jgi:hypothetical protein
MIMQAETVNVSNEHDEKGRFKKGNRGGPGNPFAGQIAAFRAILINAVTPDDMLAIAQALIEKAKEGNLQATKLLFSYIFGKPQGAPAPTPADLESAEPVMAASPRQQTEKITPSPTPPVEPICKAPVPEPGHIKNAPQSPVPKGSAAEEAALEALMQALGSIDQIERGANISPLANMLDAANLVIEPSPNGKIQRRGRG